MITNTWVVYLAGEIHSDWREKIISGANDAALPITFTSPVTDHSASDNCGVTILGDEDKPFWKDHKGAKLNAIRTRTMISDADIVVARFGEQYKQWNTAFDAGYAAALGKALIVQHPDQHTHALKEI
ncbi:MAG: YtoQ family protein, partial [candidate division Zixibacteria bacterium]|nr:YtoQ family protein [candidate division Zixibacteria bacterium]